jgi:hypothetical protein
MDLPEMEMREYYRKLNVHGSISSVPGDVFLTYDVGVRWIETDEGPKLKEAQHVIHVSPDDRKVYLVEVIYKD